MYVNSYQRHNQALLAPNSKDEKAIVNLLRGLQAYQELLQADESQRPSAAALQGMSDIARGLHKLIQQGPLGRLDRSLIEAAIAPFITEPSAGTLSLVQDHTVGPSESQDSEPLEAARLDHRRSARPA